MVMADLAVVGHVAIDKVITSTEERTQLGGPPTYVSLIAHVKGLDTVAVTKVGGDFPSSFLGQLRGLGVDLRGQIIEGAETTRFILDYRGAERRLSVESVCDDIRPEDVRDLPDAVLISPIVGEVPPPTVSILMEAEFIVLDPQGFVREVHRDGSVRPKRWLDERLLRRVTVYKSSEEELKLMTGEADLWRGLRGILEIGAEVAIATKGAQGSLLLTRGGRYRIPAYDNVEVVDLTGAGDTFMGGFLSEYLQGEDASWCAAVGGAAASCVVETIGACINVSTCQLSRRAEDIYNDVIKL